jgi:hypothetical protein
MPYLNANFCSYSIVDVAECAKTVYSLCTRFVCHYGSDKPLVAQLEEHGTITVYLAIPRSLVRLQSGGYLFLAIGIIKVTAACFVTSLSAREIIGREGSIHKWDNRTHWGVRPVRYVGPKSPANWVATGRRHRVVYHTTTPE